MIIETVEDLIEVLKRFDPHELIKVEHHGGREIHDVRLVRGDKKECGVRVIIGEPVNWVTGRK